MRIVILTRNLGGVVGGIEKSIFNITSNLNEFEFHIISMENSDESSFFSLPSNTKWHRIATTDLNVRASWRNRIQRQIDIYMLMNRLKPRVVLAFMVGTYWVSILPCKILRIPVVICERTTPKKYKSKTKIRYFLFCISMIFSKKIVVQFENFIYELPKFLRHKSVAIANFVENQTEVVRKEDNFRRFLIVGRLVDGKNVIKSVEYFIKYAKNNSHHISLSIYGEGEDYHLIEDLITTSNCKNIVTLNKFNSNMELIYPQHDVLIHLSDYEGFPNSVAEALSFGMPILGLKNCDGVRDLVENNKNGWLMNSLTYEHFFVLIDKIVKCTNREVIDYRSNSRKSIKKYDPKIIKIDWINFLKDF